MDDGRQREAHGDLSNKFFSFWRLRQKSERCRQLLASLVCINFKSMVSAKDNLFMARDSWSGHFEWRVCMWATVMGEPSGARFIFLSTHSCCCSFCLWSIGGIPELGSSADHPVRYLGAGWIFVRFIIVIGRQVELDSEKQFWLTVNRS